jgi:hypothetical protein
MSGNALERRYVPRLIRRAKTLAASTTCLLTRPVCSTKLHTTWLELDLTALPDLPPEARSAELQRPPTDNTLR